MKAKVKTIKIDFDAETIPTTHGGASGREVERIVKKNGFPLQNGAGADWKEVGVEVKSRDENATSPRTIASMTIDDIIATPYEDSVIAEKCQQQYIVKHEDGKVTDADVYDFSPKHIQRRIKEAYEAARAEFINGNRGTYVRGKMSNGKCAPGYFEQTTSSENSRSFRFSDADYKSIEGMAKSTYTDLFEET